MEGSSEQIARPSRRSLTASLATALAVMGPLEVAVLAARSLVVDPDVFWVAAAGRAMLRTGSVPRENMFSFVDAHHPWVMHEWLLAIPYALGERAFGPAFFVALSVALACAVAWVVLAQTWGRARSASAGLASAAAAAFALTLYSDRIVSARPIGVSLLLALCMILLAMRPSFGMRHAILAAGVELLWANTHGSFPLGVLILLAGLAHAARSQRRWHGVAVVAAVAATFVNPYGTQLHALVWEYARASSLVSRLIHERVLEFSPVWRAGYHVVVGPAKLAGLAALSALAGFALTKPAHRARAALTLLLVASALVLARQVDLAGLCATVLMAPFVMERFERGPEIAPRPWLGPAVAFVVGMFVVGLEARARPRVDWISPSLGGPDFVHLVEQLPDGAHVYVPFRSGGLLLALAAERGVTTFYDSRNDCYSPDVARAGLMLKDGEAPEGGIADLFRRYGVEYAVVPLASYVDASPAYDARWRALGLFEPALQKAGWQPVASRGGWTILRYTSPRE